MVQALSESPREQGHSRRERNRRRNLAALDMNPLTEISPALVKIPGARPVSEYLGHARLCEVNDKLEKSNK